MDIKRLEQIKSQLETLKSNKAKAEGNIEQIQQSWKDDFDITTVDEAEKYLARMECELNLTMDEIKTVSTELEESYNWS